MGLSPVFGNSARLQAKIHLSQRFKFPRPLLNKKKAISEIIYDDLAAGNIENRNGVPYAWNIFVVCVLSALLNDTSILSKYLRHLAVNKQASKFVSLMKYDNRGRNVNISAIYKAISASVSTNSVIKQWVIGEGFKIEGYQLPQRISDPDEILWRELNGSKKHYGKTSKKRSSYALRK